MFEKIWKALGLCSHKWKFERMGAFADSVTLLPVYKCERCHKIKVMYS